MLAAFMVISIVSGATAVAAVLMLDLPLWASFLGYSVGGSFGLFVTACITASDSRQTQKPGVVGVSVSGLKSVRQF